MQKVNPTHKKERKQQKGEVKGKRLFVKLKMAKRKMFQKQRKGAKGQKQYKKGKKTAVETHRHCKRAKTAPKRQRMKQPRIRKQRAKFQMATGEMSQKQRKGAKGKNNIKKVRKRLLC